ncbi:MAG: Rpn family recombination-promoting nuclease/putative transposase [Muribaculaceae bacterium]|nr:Rpn family recombination-promoting nuclease/putative transposase [Muribaculaceae bacterium]
MKTTVDDLLKRTFIKLRSDWGFKRAFATPENAEVLKKFLNALFEGKMVIKDVTFQDKEVLPLTASGKRSYYDAYCTTNDGNHFIVEMQRKPAKLFGNRMVFYISACIFRQGVKGGNYKFDPVYLIVITDFDMQPFEKRIVNEVLLIERETHIVLTEDFKIFFLSLNQVAKEWEDCKTELERRLYLIKNMEKLNKDSKPYKSGEYEEMFNASEIASIAAEDLVEYRTSIIKEMERESELEYAKEEGIEKGKLEVAIRMRENGFSNGDIMLATGLSEQQIESL